MQNCYKNIIGFSRTECECTQEGRPEDFNESKSGLYLDELHGIQGLEGFRECDTTIWDEVEKARTSAVLKFIADTNALLAGKYMPKREAYSGVIGQIKKKEAFNATKNYSVIRIHCAPISSGFMHINGIGTLFENTGTVQVDIYNNVDGFMQSVMLDTQAMKHKSNPLNIVLPMWSKYTTSAGLEYYLVYENNSSNKAKDTTCDCGCGGGIHLFFDKRAPYYYKKHKRGEEWTQYIQVGGNQINSISELDDLPNSTGNKMYGITLDVAFTCKVNEVICKDSLDYEANPLAMSIAHCVYYMAGSLFADWVMRTGTLTRENMINLEALKEAQSEWIAHYNEHVNYIVSNVQISASDCLVCRDVNKITKLGLFA